MNQTETQQDETLMRYSKFATTTRDSLDLVWANPAITEFLKEIASMYMSHKILVTGIGKCSFLAMKHAATLRSLCFDAEYLDAVNAVHGDLGTMFNKHDDRPVILIALSKSGMSQELIPLFSTINAHIPKVQQFMITMPIFSEKQTAHFTKIVAMGVQLLELPCGAIPELDGHGIVPSASNMIFEMVLSGIVSLLPISDEELLTRLKVAHPGGSLQEKVTKILELNQVG